LGPHNHEEESPMCEKCDSRLIDDTPILSDALAAKEIAISGGVYDIATGKVGLI
jgi:carbonic anhydrase